MMSIIAARNEVLFPYLQALKHLVKDSRFGSKDVALAGKDTVLRAKANGHESTIGFNWSEKRTTFVTNVYSVAISLSDL